MAREFKKGSLKDRAVVKDYVKEVYYEKTGESFYVKKLTVAEYEKINKQMLKQELAIKDFQTNLKALDRLNTSDLIVITIISGLCDEEGNKLLDETDFDDVKKFDNELATLLYKEIITLNNPEFEEVKKNIM